MYEIFLSAQYIGIVILAIELIYVFMQKPSRLQTYFIGLIIALLINFVGYSMELTATSKETALQAVKIIYVGKPFIAFSTFVLVMHYCKVRLNKCLSIVLLNLNVATTLLVFLCEKHKLYYSSIDFTQEGMFPHLILKHGPLYICYMTFVGIYALVCFVVPVLALRKATNDKQKKQLIIFIVIDVTTVFSLIIYLSGITNGYDTTLLGYLLASILLFMSMFRVKVFDTITIAKDQALDLLNEGVVVFDNTNNIIFMNDSALKICRNLNKKESQFLMNLSITLDEAVKAGETVMADDKVYTIVKHSIRKSEMDYGFMYVFNDITDSYYYVNGLKKEVEEKASHVNTIQRKVTLGMADMVESRDSNTGGHVKRTSEVVRIFVESLKERADEKLQYSDDFLTYVINAAPMHDLGKISVQDAILRKPGAFTPEEYEEMKTHASKGAGIVKHVLSGIEDAEFVRVATNIAHYHHEKYDGSGYPKGLKGESIPLEARMMALADVFDALVSKRCYKEKMSYDDAFRIIEESLDTHFDRELGLRFLECREKLIQYYEMQD